MSEQPLNDVPEQFVTPATRRGYCPICDTQILRGEMIVKALLGQWAHEDCVEWLDPADEAAA